MPEKNCYSIIVPVFNSERYLASCLNSIILQTYKNLDIIIINDGSTDSSLKICKEYEKNDPRIRLFSQENKGVSATRNKGICEAKGDYVIFIDSDDWIENNTIERINNRLELNKVDLIIHKLKPRKR